MTISLAPFCVVSTLKPEVAMWYHDVPVPAPAEVNGLCAAARLLHRNSGVHLHKPWRSTFQGLWLCCSEERSE